MQSSSIIIIVKQENDRFCIGHWQTGTFANMDLHSSCEKFSHILWQFVSLSTTATATVHCL